MNKKQCTKCKKYKPLNEFSIKTANKIDGHASWCKECVNEYNRSISSEQYQKNKEYYKEKNKTYYHNNKKYFKTANKLYYENNYKKCWITKTYNNHKNKGFIINVSKNFLSTLVENTKYCPICGCKLKWNVGKIAKNSPTIDRVNNETELREDNIWIICHKCNTLKNITPLNEYLESLI